MFGDSVFCPVAIVMLSVVCTLNKITGFQFAQIFMGFQLTLSYLQHLHRHIGAVCCASVIGVEQIFQCYAVFNRAKTIAESADMVGLDLLYKRGDDLILRLDESGGFKIIGAERGSG